MQIDISENEIAGGGLLESKLGKEPEKIVKENHIPEAEVKKGKLLF